jgi:hypothetical protein
VSAVRCLCVEGVVPSPWWCWGGGTFRMWGPVEEGGPLQTSSSFSSF